MFHRTIYLLSLCLLCANCATPKKSRIALTSIAFASGLGIGAVTAPKDERKELHAMYWGGILGLGAAILGNYLYDDEEEFLKAHLENGKLKAELDLIQNSNTVLLKEGKGYFKNGNGEEYFENAKAKWRIYQIDRWTKDSSNKLYHQDKMVELVPAPHPQ